MYKYPPDILQTYIDYGLACAITGGVASEQLVGFVKADPIVKNADGAFISASEDPATTLHKIESGEVTLAAFEVGSRVVDPIYQNMGIGTQLKDEIAQSVSLQYPEVPIFSVVASNNEPSKKSNIAAGWTQISETELKELTGGLGIFDDWTQTSVIYMYDPSQKKNQNMDQNAYPEKIENHIIKTWTPEAASKIYQTLEVHNWAPWLAASEESLIGRSLVFPDGQLLIEAPNGEIIASVSTNRINWDGKVESLPNWDAVAGDPTTYEQTYIPDGNTLALMSMNVHPKYKKNGLATKLIKEVQEVAKALGIQQIVGSFRPSEYGTFKQTHDEVTFEEYISMKRDEDGLPIDAWIRSLVRSGMQPLKVDKQAMTVSGIDMATFVELQNTYHVGMWKKVGENTWECGEVGQWTVDPHTQLATYVESNLWGIIQKNN